jgi:hypothetical protein
MSYIWIDPKNPEEMVEGAYRPLSFRFHDDITVDSVVVYHQGVDVSSTVLSGSNSVSGRTLTTKTVTAQAGHGGSSYVMVVAVIASGRKDVYKRLINIIEPKRSS